MTTEKLIEIIGDFADIEGLEINDSTKIRNEIGLNSFDLINVAVAIENASGVKIPDEKLSNVHTIGELKALIG